MGTPTRGQRKVVKAWMDEAVMRVGANGNCIQRLYEANSEARQPFETELDALVLKYFGPNQYHEDGTAQQTFFEPANWAKPLAEQIALLQAALPGATLNADYLAARQAEPTPEGYVRVVVPKLNYLQSLLRPADLESDQPWDIYENIGTAIEHVCAQHEQKHGARFKNCRKGELGPNRVRCHQQAAERRRKAEAAVPGDILILDVDLGNHILGGKEKLCHTPRWSREEIGLSDNLMDLSSVDVGWILYLNEARLTQFKDLCVDCTLEEYYWDGDGWVVSLYWLFYGERLHFGYRDGDYANGHCAAGVARLPGVTGDSALGNLA